MKKIILPFTLLLLFATPAAAQGGDAQAQKKPGITGVWIPSVEKERKPDAGSDGWTHVRIERQGEAVKFTLTYPAGAKPPTREFVYYADGRGETNSGTVYFFLVANGKLPDDKVESKTTWDGDALVIVHRLVTQSGPAVTVSLDLTMRWEVSADGRTLTRTMKQSNYSAVYRQLTREGKMEERQLPVTLNGAGAGVESKDTYVLLEEKR